MDAVHYRLGEGTSVAMISKTYAKVLAGHQARYAAMVVPTLLLDRSRGGVAALGR